MIEDNNIDPKYRDNVYNALKLKVSGFDKSPEEFKEALKSKEYVKNVHNALKLKVSGFDKDLSTFESLVYENTIQKKNQIGNGDSTTKETPSVSSSKIQPVTSLGGEKIPTAKASDTSTGVKITPFKGFSKEEMTQMKKPESVIKQEEKQPLKSVKKAPLYAKQLKLQRELSTAVVTPENQDEIQQKTDELAKIKSESMKSGKKEPDFVDSLVNNLDVASFSLSKMAIKDAPEFAFDLVTTIGAKAAEVLGDDTLKAMTKYKSDDVAKILGFRNLPAEELQRQIDVANNKIQEYNDNNGGDAITAISNGNYLGASKIIAGSTVQSLPLVLAAMTTGGGALPAIFATSASMEYGELKKNAPEMSDEVKLGSAIGVGIFEGFLGKLFSGASGLAVKRILADKGVEEGSKIVKRGIISSLSNVIGKNPIVSLVGEMGEEGSVEFGNQTIQILNGTRKDYDIKGIGNAAVSSSGIGLTSTTAVYGAKGYMKIADYKKAKNVNKEIDKSINELSNPILTDTDKQTLSNRIDRLSEENRNIVKQSLDNIKSLPTPVKNEVYDINNNLEDLKIRTLDIQDNSAMSQETKETLLSEIKREANDLVDRRSKIIDGTYIYDDFNKLSDSEKIDRKDKAGIELLNEAKAKGAEKVSFDDAQITKKAVEDYGNERKQRSDREAANQEEPTGDQAVSEYTQPTGEGEKGVRGVQEKIDKTYYYNTDPKRGPVESAPETLPEGYSSAKAVSNSAELDFWKNQKSVESLRKDEQQELLDAIPNASNALTDGKVDKDKLTTPEDKAKFDEIYNKYDKLITPLLEVTKPAEAKVTTTEKTIETKDFDLKLPNNKDNIIVVDTTNGFALYNSETNRPVEVLNENAGKENVGISKPYATQEEAQARIEELKTKPTEIKATPDVVSQPIDLTVPSKTVEAEVKSTESTIAEAPIVETPKESKARQTLVDKTKNAEAELKDAWKNLSNLGAIYDPKVQAAKQVAMNKAIVKYVVNKIALGAYDVNTFVKDMASNGIELTKEGADFLFDKSQKAYKTQIEKLTGVSKKPSVGKALEQKRINKAYSIGVAEQKVKTEEAKTKLTEAKSEIKELKDKVKDIFSASIEAVKQVKNRVDKNTKVRFEIGGAIKSLANRGKITQKQSADISKKLSELNVENEQDIRDFLDYVDDVFLKSDKYQKIADADKLSARLKSMSKDKTKDNTTRSVTSRLAKIDPSKVKDIDKHTEILKKAIDGLRGSVIKTVNGEKRIEEKRPVNIKEVLEYITEQDEFQYKQAKSEYEDLFGVEPESDLSYEDIKQKISELRSARSLYKRITGKSGSKLTLEKISEMLFEESDKDPEFSEQYKQDAEFILNESKMLAKQIADSGKNPLTGDDLSQRDKNIISSISNFTSKDLSVKQVIDLSNRLNNFYENGVLGGLGDMASKIDGNKSVLDFNKNNRKGIKYRRFFNGDLGVAMGRYLVNPRLIVDEVFRGRQAGEDFWVACGVRGFQNGKAGGIKKASLVLDEFEKFNDNKKNKDFMEIENIYERGMWAHVAREVGVNESEIGENFIKVKDWMKQSYESLLGSKDKDKIKKGESVKIVYDKILKDSNNIEEVKSKVSDVNKQAVKVYQDAFEAEYENTKFTKDAYLNESLRKDNGYAFPVKFGNADIAQKDVTDTALGSTRKVSLRQKATSMNDDTRSSKLGDKYIDLDFDRLAHQEFEKVCIANAVIPHATQYQSFKTNPLFKEIIKDDSTRKLIETTLDNYIIVSQGVNVDKIEYEWNGMNRLMDRANKMAIAQALISVSQPLKQVLPMIPSTVINSGNFDLTVVNNKDFHSFLNESSTSTSIRGFGSLISYDSAAESLKAAEKGNFGKLLQFVDKVNDKELSVLLRGSDSFVAGVSWASYYQQKAGKVSDWKKEKENPNKSALNYADSMVDADQGSSDPDLVGEVFRKKGLQGALIKFMMPLARFSINTKSNIYKNIVISSSKFSSKSDKIEALRGLSGSMVQLAAFKYVSQSVYNIVSDAASYAVGDDEEEKKEFEKILEKEKESNAMLELVGRTLIDAFSVIPATDEIVLELINIASDLINNDTPDALKPEMMNYKNSSYGTGLGLISIPYREMSKVIEQGQVVYNGLVGSDNIQTLKAQKYASPLLGISIIRALVGIIPSELGKFAEKSIKQTPTTVKGVKLAIGKGVEEETKVEKTIKRMKKEGKEEAKKEKSKLQKWLDRNKE